MFSMCPLLFGQSLNADMFGMGPVVLISEMGYVASLPVNFPEQNIYA
jgi:hypothetical protein